MDKQAILNGGYFSLDEKSGMKFRLAYQNWNDFGYYTLYTLEMKLPKSNDLYRIADIRIMNVGQKFGDKPSWFPTTPIVFISNVSSAERLLLYLSPEQRKNLENILLIRYESYHIEHEKVFLKSILRDKTLLEFTKSQERIREIIHLPLDVSSIINDNKSQLSSYMDDINTHR